MLRVLCIWAIALGVTSVSAESPVNVKLASQAKPMNVVLIIADDLGWGELGCYGQQKIRTPNIDALARSGIRFTNHYSGAPVCAPARCTLMTGLHLGHAQIRGNKQAQTIDPKYTEGQIPIHGQTLTLPRLFQQSGYRTAAFGKWGLGPVNSDAAPHRIGFDLFFGYNCQAIAHSYFPRHLWRNDEKVIINQKPIPGHKRQPEGDVLAETYLGEQYSPDLMANEAVKFIQESSEKPFFLYLPFIEPHVAMHPPTRLVESYPKEWDPEPYRGQCGYLPHPRPRAAYAAMITHLDEHVGRVMKALEEKKLLDNTLIIFTSDNGTTHLNPADKVFGVGGVDAKFFNSTRELRGFKGSTYEGGIRVPMIVRHPANKAPGEVNEQVCYFPDHFSTLAALLKADLKQTTPELPVSGSDGENLLDVWQGAAARERTKPMVWAFPEYGGQFAVRIGDYKVVRQNVARPRQSSAWELYDIKNDPSEKTDLASKHPELVAQGVAILNEQVSENKHFPMKVPTN